MLKKQQKILLCRLLDEFKKRVIYLKNYKITAQYDGTKYNGWQKQGNTKNTIQHKFEDVVQKMCGTNVEINASGRTDAGVHALCQVANFKCSVDMTSQEIMDYINKYLPEDILVTSVCVADDRFHARLNAVSKTYQYTIATQKPDVFIRKYVYKTDSVPDVSKMKKASKMFLGTHDFKGFCSDKTKKSTVRTINFIDIEHNNGIIKIIVNGSGFLYNMVRIIAGTLLDIGLGKLNESIIEEVFKTKDRSKGGTTLPAKGLILKEVLYEK